jgi:PAS domain S-box-containing protein
MRFSESSVSVRSEILAEVVFIRIKWSAAGAGKQITGTFMKRTAAPLAAPGFADNQRVAPGHVTGADFKMSLLALIARELTAESVRLLDPARHIVAKVDRTSWVHAEPVFPARERAVTGSSVLSKHPLSGADGCKLGVVEWVGPERQSRATRQRVDTLLNAVAVALALEKQEKAQIETAHRLNILVELTEAAARAANYPEALAVFLKIISGALEADCAQAWSIARDGRDFTTTLESVYTRPRTRAREFCKAVELALKDGNHRRFGSGMVHRNGLLIASTDELDVEPGTYLSLVKDHGLRSIVSAPVDRGDMTLGLTFLFKRDITNTALLRQLMADISPKISELLQRKLHEDRVGLLTSALEGSNDAVMITEADGLRVGLDGLAGPSARLIYVNAAFMELTGYSATEAIGQPMTILYGPQTDLKIVKAAIESRRRRQPAHGEIVYYRKDGTPHWIRFSSAPIFDAKGNCSHYVSISRDITDWREAQDALAARTEQLRRVAEEQRAILDTLPVNLALLDADGRIRATNKGWNEFGRELNVGSPLDWRGIDYFATCRQAAETGVEYLSGGWRAMEEVIAGASSEAAFDYPCDTPTGERWFRCFFVALPDRRSGFLVMHIDVTLRIRAIDQMAAALKAAEDADRTKSEFLANMSHELRTPLNAICGFSEILKNEILGPLGHVRYKDYAQDIHDSGSHLLNIVNDVLDMAKIAAGAMVLHPEWIEPRDPIGLAIKLCASKIGSSAIRIDSDDLDAVPALYVDERRLVQVLLNLISNAVKFSPSGSRVDVKLGKLDDGSFRLDVIDVGIGMSDAEIEVALQPFRQVEGHIARSREGTGLGLPLAKHLAELNGATLTIASEKGSGTRISLIWPEARVKWEL